MLIISDIIEHFITLPKSIVMITLLKPQTFVQFHYLVNFNGARGSVVVKALRYKPEGRGFDSR
jgi:hypothetical protein